MSNRGVVKAQEVYGKYFSVDDVIWKTDFTTDLKKIADELNLRIVNVDMAEAFQKSNIVKDKKTRGFLLKDDDEYTIVVNKDYHLNSRRFTIAHEIGHYCLNHLANETSGTTYKFRDASSSKGTDPQEIEANTFAAELLMPEKLIKHWYYITGSIPETAEMFTVSEETVKFRLENLGMI